MRWPVRPRSHASSLCCPRGQVGRGLTCALALTLTTPARAQEPVTMPVETSPEPTAQDEAIRLFRAAKELYSAGAYADAARRFADSYAAAASPEAAYNAALAHDKVGADLATMTWYRRYLATASGSDPSYPQALQRIEELRARLGELRLQIDSNDEIREVRVNDETVALADFPKLVAPGRVAVHLTGATPAEVADIPAEVAPGGTWTIHFTGFARARPADPEPGPPVVRTDPAPVTPPKPRARPLAALFWTGTGLTGASAIAMGVLGGLVLRERADYRECVRTDTCDQSRHAYTRYRDATNVMVSVTAGLAVVTLALGIAALRERRKARSEAPGGRLRVTLAGVQLAF